MLQRLVRRAGVPIVQKANVSAQVKFTPIKRVKKCPEGYLRNSNPLVDGKVLIRKWKSSTGRDIDFVLGVPKDRDLLATFFGEGFSSWNSCCVHYNMTFEEFECMAAPGTDLMLEKGKIFCAYDGDKLVGTLFTSYNYPDKFEEMYHGEMPGMKNPVFRVKEDYAEDFKKYSFAPSMNYLMCLLDVVQPQTGKFLPAGIKGFGIHEIALIHKDYHKDGIAQVFLDLSDKAFQDSGIYHLAGYCIADGTRKVMGRSGYKSIYKLPYTDFKINGKPVYENLYDGAKWSETFVKFLK